MKSLFTLILTFSTFVLFSQNLIPPSNLEAEVVNENDVNLTWAMPDTTADIMLTWASGTNTTSIGLGAAGSFSVAAKWTADEIEDLDGAYITAVNLFLADENTDYTLKVWEGDNAETLVYEQEITNFQTGDFSAISLDEAVEVNTGQELWVGYEMNIEDFSHPAGLDGTTSDPGSGDMIYYEEQWSSLSNVYGITGNWNIVAYFSFTPQNGPATFSPLSFSHYETTGSLIQSDQQEVFTLSSDRDNPVFEGYNVYRDDVQLNEDLVTETSFTDAEVAEGFYQYGVQAIYNSGESNIITTPVQVGDFPLYADPESYTDTIGFQGSGFIPFEIINENGSDLSWIASSTASWISVFPHSGTVGANSSSEINLHYSVHGLAEGVYEEVITLEESDTGTPLVEIPVTIVVVGMPQLSFFPHSVDFGEVPYQETASSVMTLHNNGNDTLFIDNISSDEEQIEVGEYPDFIMPFEGLDVEVFYTATEIGNFEGEVLIDSNDPNQPEAEIPVFASTTIEAPQYLSATIVNEDDVSLEWALSFEFDENWISWGDDENYTAIGVGSGSTLTYGQKWNPEDLTDYSGNSISKVAFFPFAENAVYTINVWSGDEDTEPQAVKTVSNTQPMEWNIATLPNSVELIDGEELWVIIEANSPEHSFPAGCDIGPAVAGKGDLIYVEEEGFVSMAEFYGLDFNWNLQAFVTDENGSMAPITSGGGESYTNDFTGINSAPVIKEVEQQQNRSANDYEFLGYNLYRNGNQVNDDFLTEETFLDEDLDLGTYQYGVTAVYNIGESEPTTATVQFGSPEPVLNPTAISDTLYSGQVGEYPVTISNNGNIDLEWEITSGFYWFSVSETEGSVAPNESQTIIVTVDTEGFFYGSFEGFIDFEFNDLDNPFASVAIDILVPYDSYLNINPQFVDYGMTPPGSEKTRFIQLSNAQSVDIEVEDIQIDDDYFTTETSNIVIGGLDSETIAITFSPEQTGEFSATATLFMSNGMTYEIFLEGEGALPPPMAFNVSTNGGIPLLTWMEPDLGSTDNTIQYSADEPFTGIGFSSGGEFTVAAKFTATELMNYAGESLTAVEFIPFSADADFTVKVWTGEEGENLVFSQNATSVNELEWNTFDLNEALPLDEEDFVWIGYTVDHEDMTFPAAVDQGPALSGMGDLIKMEGTDGWVSLENMYNLSNNWNVRGITDGTGSSDEFELLGYNIYRNSTLVNTDGLYEFTLYRDVGVEPGLYEYEVTAVYDLGESNPAGPVEVVIEEQPLAPEGWDTTQTDMSHVVVIPGNNAAMSGSDLMSPGDWIGLFYDDNGTERLGGMVAWDGMDNMYLLAYGDDPDTPEKEGFEIGETMHWKAWIAESGETHEMTVEYNGNMPDSDGTFDMLGMSMLDEMDMLNTSVTTEAVSQDVTLYPNPAYDKVTVSGVSDFETYYVVDIVGKVIESGQINASVLRLNTADMKGTYFVVLRNSSKVETKKVLVY
ncbi:MAG: choice-of-anchor D domain-containing protein [Bacteroidota bacterium]